MFKLDLENPEVKEFIKLYWMVVERETERLLKEDKPIMVKVHA